MPCDDELVFAVAIVNVARLRLFAPLWRRIRVLAIWSSFDDPFRGRDCGLARFIPGSRFFFHSVAIPPFNVHFRSTRQGALVRSVASGTRGRRLILRIEPAESVEPARGLGALFKSCEAAVCNPANHSIAVNCAPRMVLDPGSGRGANPDDADTKDTEHEWQDPHDRLLIGGS